METRPPTPDSDTPTRDPYAQGAPRPAPYTPGPPPRDNRTLIVAGVIVPLVILTAVISYYLLVAVPAREDRERDAVAVVGETALTPEAVASEGDGFEPGAVDIDVPEASADDAGEGGEYGLEGAPRRADNKNGSGGLGGEAPPYGQPAPEPLQAFARRYLRAQEGDAESLTRLYRTPMPYNGMPENGDGQVFGSTIYQERQSFFSDFPNRRYQMAGPATTVDSEGEGDMIRFDYTFSRSGGPGGQRSGRAWVELAYAPAGNSFVIVGENGGEY